MRPYLGILISPNRSDPGLWPQSASDGLADPGAELRIFPQERTALARTVFVEMRFDGLLHPRSGGGPGTVAWRVWRRVVVVFGHLESR